MCVALHVPVFTFSEKTQQKSKETVQLFPLVGKDLVIFSLWEVVGFGGAKVLGKKGTNQNGQHQT